MIRDALDRYYTPDDVAALCVAVLPKCAGAHALEPASGGGAFVRALGACGVRSITTVDLDETVCNDGNHHIVGDFLSLHPDDLPDIDLVVGNPPYRHALAFVRRSLDLVGDGGTVAFLLRLGFLASQSRAAFFRESRPAWVHILSKRPSFTGDGKTDGSDYTFVVWVKGNKQPTQLGWL